MAITMQSALKDLDGNCLPEGSKVATTANMGNYVTNNTYSAGQAEQDARINAVTAASGNKADLVNGKVPASQLPAYVDEIMEFSSRSAFPPTGEADKLYYALDDNTTYRWSGSTYVNIDNDKQTLSMNGQTLAISGGNSVQILSALSPADIAGLMCAGRSQASGNLLQCRDDGLYYGIEPPANLANQYVDPVNGSDTNAGTPESPLRTEAFAASRLPANSRGTIYLIDNATHYIKSSDGVLRNKTITYYPYGDATDIAQATWDAQASGWHWLGWKDAPLATIEFIYDVPYNGGGEVNKMLGLPIRVETGFEHKFNGIRFITPSVDNVTGLTWFQGAISGNGIVTLVDCEIHTPKYPLITSALDTSPTFTFNIVSHTGAREVFDMGSGGTITGTVASRSEGQLNPQGLPYRVGNSGTYYATKVANRMTPVAVSPNFNVNF